jgi:hypothetical protein
MNRYINAKCILLVLLMPNICLSGCEKNVNITTEPMYLEMANKLYATKADLLIIEFKDNLGQYILDQSGYQRPSVEDVKKAKLPIDDEEATIHGILPSGSILKIEKIELQSHVTRSDVHFYARVIRDGRFQERIIDIWHFIDPRNNAINEKYIGEMEKAAD